MAVLPISSEADKTVALRQIDLNFRELAAKVELLEKKIKNLENH